MDYNIKHLYESTMSALIADYGKVRQTTMAHSERYFVTIERTPNFTVLWDGMILLAVYDWNNHIALDLTGNADCVDFIIERFFWFAE